MPTPVPYNPFAGCTLPPVLSGTGTLYVQDLTTGLDESIGNVEMLGFAGDGDDLTIFEVGQQYQSALAVTNSMRFDVTADYYSIRNLARLLNATQTPILTGWQIPLQTVRVAPSRRVIFEKELEPACGFSSHCLRFTFWRAHFQIPFDLGLERDGLTQMIFALIALPDAVNHPSQPYGLVEEDCEEVAS